MSATETTIETLATRSGHGSYGMVWESRLIRRGDKHYLLHDSFCGMDSIKGGCYRPFVYEVPAERVAEVLDLFRRSDEDMNEHVTRFQWMEMFLIPELRCLGRQSRIAWARSL